MKNVYIFDMSMLSIDEICDILESNGILSPESVKNTTVPMDVDYYIQKIATQMGWSFQKTDNYLYHMATVNLGSTISMLLKTIAVELDKKYPDHIKNSKEIYSISLISGKIGKISKEKIKSFNNFAAFRTMEDAEVAYHIMSKYIELSFNGRK